MAQAKTKSRKTGHLIQSRRGYSKGGLGKWFGEEWTDVKTGKECGRSGSKDSGRPYPACRPKAVASKISKKEAAKKKFKTWPSAYGSAWLVKEYKRRGGKYSGSSKNKVA